MSFALKLLLFSTLAACSNRPAVTAHAVESVEGNGFLPLSIFYSLLADNRDEGAALDRIESEWDDAYAAMLLEMIYFSTSPEIDGSMTRLLEQASGLMFRGDYDPFYRWLWSFDPVQHPEYAAFTSALYDRIDPSFREYFDDRPTALIRLDQRLPNKAEILALRYDDVPLAIAATFLKRNP